MYLSCLHNHKVPRHRAILVQGCSLRAHTEPRVGDRSGGSLVKDCIDDPHLAVLPLECRKLALMKPSCKAEPGTGGGAQRSRRPAVRSLGLVVLLLGFRSWAATESCQTLGRFPKLSRPQFLHFQNRGDNITDISFSVRTREKCV